MSTYRYANLSDRDDRQFILSGWSASQRMTRDIPLIAMESWADVWHPIVTRAMTHPRTQLIIAAGSVPQGFIAYWQPSYVLYVYVAQPFRKNGIARGLFAAAGIDSDARFSYACRTKASWELMLRGKAPLAHYDPYQYRFDDTGERTDEQR